MTFPGDYLPNVTLAFPEAGESITVALHQITDPARIALLHQRLGLNESDAILEGRMITPLALPSTIVPGMRANLHLVGTLGVATLQPYHDHIPARWLPRYGQRIVLSWVSAEA